jgi:hypothetical protein
MRVTAVSDLHGGGCHIHQPLVSGGTIGSSILVNVGHFQAYGTGYTIDGPD